MSQLGSSLAVPSASVTTSMGSVVEREITLRAPPIAEPSELRVQPSRCGADAPMVSVIVPEPSSLSAKGPVQTVPVSETAVGDVRAPSPHPTPRDARDSEASSE